METLIFANIFFIISTIFIIFLTAIFIFLLVYVLPVIKNVCGISRLASDEIKKIISDFQRMRQTMEKGESTVKSVVGYVISLFGKPKKSRK